jgi:hypothetical protein
VARHSNLSGVAFWLHTYERKSVPSLVLHVRSHPDDKVDIATVRVPASEVTEYDPWLEFTFPAIGDSLNRPFYIELEVDGQGAAEGPHSTPVTVFWLKDENAGGDAYRDGVSYFNGYPWPGDLGFGILYTPTPLSLLADMARQASTNFPPPLMALVALVATGGAVLLILRGRAVLRKGSRGGLRAWLIRRALPISLAIAGMHGTIYAFLIPPWQGPDEQAHFAFAALLDKHNLDHSTVRNLEWWGKDRDRALIDAVNSSMDRNNFTLWLAGHSSPGSTTNVGDVIYAELRQPPTYYWIGAVAMRAARAVGADADPYTRPEVALRTVRLASVFLSLGTVALGALAARLLSRRRSWIRLLLPLTLALLPMRVFIDSMANNDVLAELTTSALFVIMVALFRSPRGGRGIALAILAVFVALLCGQTKLTALAAGTVLIALGVLTLLVTWVAQRARQARLATKTLGTHIPTARVLLPIGIVGALALAAVASFWLLFEPQETAAGWVAGESDRRARRVPVTAAREGSYALELAPGQEAFQWVDINPAVVRPPALITFGGWARPVRPALSANAQSAHASIVVDHEAGSTPASEMIRLETGAWTYITGTLRVAFVPDRVQVRLASDGAPVQFDDLSLVIRHTAGEARDSAESPLALFNSSAEVGAWGLRPPIAGLLGREPRHILDALVNPQPFDKLALGRYYAEMQFTSFWGNFGWLSIPLPGAFYFLAGAISFIAIIGLVVWNAFRRWRWTYREWLGTLSLLAVAVTVFIGFARQMTPLVTLGFDAPPQGRYLFVLIVPIVWLLLSGAGTMWALLTHITRRARGLGRRGVWGAATESGYIVPWGVWLWGSAFLLLMVYCIAALITPYYYR